MYIGVKRLLKQEKKEQGWDLILSIWNWLIC